MWTKTGFTLLAGGLATSCFTAPARSSGPSQWDGVEMAIVGQYCEDGEEADDRGEPVVQLRMKVSVTNRGNERLAFDPDRLRLIEIGRAHV